MVVIPSNDWTSKRQAIHLNWDYIVTYADYHVESFFFYKFLE